MRILALVGKQVDEQRVSALLGFAKFEMTGHDALSNGVRRLEKAGADAVVLVPDAGDETWLRAVCRIREEYHAEAVVLLPDGADPDEGLEAGAFDVFALETVTPEDLERSFRHLARQMDLAQALAQHRIQSDWVEEAGRMGSWVMDGQGKTAWSRGVRRILEPGDAELSDSFESIRPFVHPEDLDIFEQANLATFDQGWPLDFEYRIRSGSGAVRYLHLHRRVERDSGGGISRAFGMLRDVTPEREFENFLFRRDAVLQVVARFAARFLREPDWESGVSDSLADLGRAMDVTRAYVFRKSRCEDGRETLTMIYEWAAPDMSPLIGNPEMQEQGYDPLYSRLLPSLLGRKVVATHVRNLHEEERQLLEQSGARSVMIVPLFEGNEWWGYMGFSEHREERDWLPVEIEAVTMVADIFGSAILRNRLADQLLAANKRAEAGSQAKSRFLANMSHEIRTPISGILGMVEMVMDMKLSPKQREYLDMIGDAARSLLVIINDVLDLSRIEAHRMELSPEDFELSPMLERTLKPFAVQAEQKGLNLRHAISGRVPRRIHGDSDRLAQVLRNLVGNAVKFTQSGFVEIDVGLAELREERVCLRFTVRDSGEGIPPDKLDDVFEMFVQADSSVEKQYQGVGLGLSICKELVTMMGGELEVKSGLGRGSSFSFTAWFSRAAAATAVAAEAPAMALPSRLHVLLAEDNQLNRRVVTHFLTKAGHRVTVAGNGMEALEALRLGGRDIDLVLMDVQMPSMGGLEATAEIRAASGSTFDPEIPIVALTAYAMKGDRERMLKAGMNDYVSKPINMKELAAAMGRALGPGQGGGNGPATCPAVEESTVSIDMEGLISHFQGDMELLKDILSLYLAEAGETLALLDRGLERNDVEEIASALHSITNIASHVMAMDIVRTSRCLERLCSEGKLDETRQDIQALRAGFVTLTELVRRRAETL